MLVYNKLWIYFLLILSLSIAGNFFILRNADLLQQNLSVWYALHIVWIGSIVLTGYACWKSHSNKWLLFLWLGIYLFAGLVFFTLGLVDVFLYRFPNILRKDIFQTRAFFFSPLPFVIIYLISRFPGNTPVRNKN